MVSSKAADSKVFRMAIQFEYLFFLIKRQNGECNVANFRRFLFGMGPDVPTFKVGIFTSDFNSIQIIYFPSLKNSKTH